MSNLWLLMISNKTSIDHMKLFKMANTILRYLTVLVGWNVFFLTHCGQVPYGHIDLVQHWFRQRFVVWKHQAINWTNVDLSTKVFCGIPPESKSTRSAHELYMPGHQRPWYWLPTARMFWPPHQKCLGNGDKPLQNSEKNYKQNTVKPLI